MDDSQDLPGLTVHLDRLVYRYDMENAPEGRPHVFIYFLTIENNSDRTVTLLGRRWLIEHPDGTQLVIEGDKIVGETPHLVPGQKFSYNSFHITSCDATAQGSFHGCDDMGRRIRVRIPAFALKIPPQKEQLI